MTTAQNYIDWIRRTFDTPQFANAIWDVRRALASGRNRCQGGLLPSEHFAEIAAATVDSRGSKVERSMGR
jgi:hypothetical protein